MIANMPHERPALKWKIRGAPPIRPL